MLLQVASLPPFLAANPSVSLPLLKALVAPPHGSHSFDHRTVEKIVAKLDLKGVRGWIKYLYEFILGGESDADEPAEVEDEKSVAARRMWAFDQLLHVVKSGVVPKDDEILAGLLEFFAVLGWFEVRKSGKGAVSSETLLSTRLTLTLCLTALLRPRPRLHRRSPNRRSLPLLLHPHLPPYHSLPLRPDLAFSRSRSPR